MGNIKERLIKLEIRLYNELTPEGYQTIISALHDSQPFEWLAERVPCWVLTKYGIDAEVWARRPRSAPETMTAEQWEQAGDKQV